MERLREIPTLPELTLPLAMVPHLSEASLWKPSRTAAHRQVEAVMRTDSIGGCAGLSEGVAPRLRDRGSAGPRRLRDDGELQADRRCRAHRFLARIWR